MSGWWASAAGAALRRLDSAARLAGDPVRPSPDEARRWATEELAKPAYGKSFLERFNAWLADLLASLFQPAGAPGAIPMPSLFAILAVLLIAAIVLLLVRASRGKRTPAAAKDPEDAVFTEPALAAAQYRRRAREALDAGDASRAVVEAFRAIAAQLLERHVLDEARDRTAHEFATAASARFPEMGGRFETAARTFDATLYGGLPATPQAARELLTLDDDLQRATPREVNPADLPAPLAVPR